MKDQTTWLEWLLFGVGLALAAGLLGFMTCRAVVPVVVRNEGGATAENVHVEVALRRVGTKAPPEQAQLTLPFLPRQSRRTARVLFTQDSQGRMEARVKSYTLP